LQWKTCIVASEKVRLLLANGELQTVNPLSRFLSLLLLCLMALTLAPGLARAQEDAPPPGCVDVLADPGFERDDVWIFTQTASPGFFDATTAYAGERSAFLGLGDEAADQNVDSTVWQQVQLPEADAITATVQVRLRSGDENDRWYVVIWDLATDESTILLYEPMARGEWQARTLDLSDFAGREVLFVVGVHNDGAGEKAALWVDEARAMACSQALTSSPSPTPENISTPTRTPTATPSPTLTPTATVTPSPTWTPAPQPSPSPTATLIPLVTPGASRRGGLPDNNALPMAAAIALSGMTALIVVITHLRR